MTQKTIITNNNILNTNLKMNPLIHLFIVLISLSSIFSYIHNPKNFLICNKLNCPPSRGVCTRDNKCICIGDYSTIRDKEKYGDYHCNYLQANQAKVFLLEFLIGLKKVKLKNTLIKLKYMASNLLNYYQNYNFKKIRKKI